MNRALPAVCLAAALAGCAAQAPPPQETPGSAAAPEPAAASEGPWRVSLISVKSEAKAESLRRRFAEKGYRVEIETVERDGATWRSLVFPGQHSRAEARQLLAQLEKEFGISGGWIPAPRKNEP